ncbi:MAG: hypothetical protein ACI84K_001427, partial [Pseudohongiellaceae bacterium]
LGCILPSHAGPSFIPRTTHWKKMMAAMQTIYGGLHQQLLTADGDAIEFYKTHGFECAGNTLPMWIYAGTEH